LSCAAGPDGGLKGFALKEGEGTLAVLDAARGPVGMGGGPVEGVVGEAARPEVCRDGPAGQPPRPPRAANPPPRAGTYPRGPDGGADGVAMSTLGADVGPPGVGGPRPGGADEDGPDEEKLRVEPGPVGGGLRAAGPRGGDREVPEKLSGMDDVYGSRLLDAPG
jgi:hypothetical protein